MRGANVYRMAALAAVLLSAVSVMANGLRNPPEGATATGLGLGKLAAIDDASAVVHNPANIAGATETEAMVGATMAALSVDFEGADGRSGSNKDAINVLPVAFGVHPLSEDVTLGMGLFVPFGQAAEWEKDGPFRGVAPYYAGLYALNVNPTLAFRLTKQLNVALGVSGVWTEIETRQLLVSPANPTGPAADAEAKGDDATYGWNLAASVKPVDGHVAAVTYRSGYKAEYEGETTISGAPPPFSPSSSFATEIEFPQIVGAGYAVALGDRLNVGLDAEWTEFSSYDALPLNFGINAPFLPFPPEVRQDWEDTWSYGLGLSYLLNDAWTLRTGYDFFESPVPEQTLSPTLPDSDRHAFSLGCAGNSARSILGEYLLREKGRGRFAVHSAGSHPTGRVNPLAVRTLREKYGLDASGARSKSWDEFKDVRFDFVITVCDHAKEACPVWPGQPMIAHWGSPDPAAAGGTEEEKYRFFVTVASQIARRVELFCAFPDDKLRDAIAVRSVGREFQLDGDSAMKP